MTYTFEDFKEDCYTFNTIAGKSSDYSKQAMYDQLKLIEEEVQEIREGLDNRDVEEILDGAVDTAVTLFGLFQKLERAGIDVLGACKVTVENNLSKFPTEYEVVAKTLDDNPNWTCTYNSEYQVFAIKDANNKVRKPVGFVSNNLKEFIPQRLLGGDE